MQTGEMYVFLDGWEKKVKEKCSKELKCYLKNYMWDIEWKINPTN